MNVEGTGRRPTQRRARQAAGVHPGTILSGKALKQILNEPDHVFREGSWEEKNIRGAGYDVRLAGDCVVYPASPGENRYIDVESAHSTRADSTRGVTEITKLVLAPGDAALISTVERFSFALDVAATMGPKFSFASQGLLMLSGHNIHPGYGRAFDPQTGDWLPEPDVRLHFVAANIGPDNIVMRRGESIAHLQFYTVDPMVECHDIQDQNFDQLRHSLFDRGPIYFRTVQDLRAELNETKKRVERIEREEEAHDTAINRMTDVTSLIIVFGVFLVSATLLGFVLTTLGDLFEKLPAGVSAGRAVLIAIFASVYGVCCAAGVIGVASVVWPMVRRMAGRKP
jgi:deoxycytidine triphosphate deaminase